MPKLLFFLRDSKINYRNSIKVLYPQERNREIDFFKDESEDPSFLGTT